MSDPRLQFLFSRDVGIVSVDDDIHYSDSIQTDHLFEIGVASSITVYVLESEIVIGTVAIRLEDTSPFLAFLVAHGHVEEDGIRRAFQNTMRRSMSAKP